MRESVHNEGRNLDMGGHLRVRGNKPELINEDTTSWAHSWISSQC